MNAEGKKTGGRKPGSRNKVTAEVKALARTHAESAIKELARLATKAKVEATRVAAIKELLDRGFGKSIQAIEGTEDGPPIKQVLQILTGVPRPNAD